MTAAGWPDEIRREDTNFTNFHELGRQDFNRESTRIKARLADGGWHRFGSAASVGRAGLQIRGATTDGGLTDGDGPVLKTLSHLHCQDNCILPFK